MDPQSQHLTPEHTGAVRRVGARSNVPQMDDKGVTHSVDPRAHNTPSTGRQMHGDYKIGADGEAKMSIGSVFDKGSPLEEFAVKNGMNTEGVFGSLESLETPQTTQEPVVETTVPVILEQPETENVEDTQTTIRMASGIIDRVEQVSQKSPALRRFSAEPSSPSSSTQMARFCSHCGSSFDKNQKFCGECGTRRASYIPNPGL